MREFPIPGDPPLPNLHIIQAEGLKAETDNPDPLLEITDLKINPEREIDPTELLPPKETVSATSGTIFQAETKA